MKKKIISYIIGVLGCIIIDAGFVVIAIHNEVPVSDYILISIFFPIIDFLFIVLISLIFEDSENKYLVIQLPDAVDNNSLPKLK